MTQQERDLACLLRLQAGDQRALEELYDRYSPLLYPLALRIVQAPPEAEDVVQEAWLQIWRRAATYDAQRGTVAAWILTVARTRALDAYRARASRERAATRSHAERPSEIASSPPSAEHGLLRERVRAALGSLPNREREVLETAYFEGLSQSEIAKRLNTPLGTVKSWTRQGLRRLRETLPNEEWT